MRQASLCPKERVVRRGARDGKVKEGWGRGRKERDGSVTEEGHRESCGRNRRYPTAHLNIRRVQ